MLSPDAVPWTIASTSGTTTGRQLFTYRGHSESAARRLIVEACFDGGDLHPLVLHLVNSGHGYDPDAAQAGVFQVPLERAFHVQTIRELLTDDFSFNGYTKRIEVLAGPLRLLKALTLSLMESGVDTSEFALRCIVSSSDHLTTRWRRLFTDFWGCELGNTYGLSEVPGLCASECGTCGMFHFSPTAITEILHPDKNQPARSYVGRLVATSLHALAPTQPMIRYDTGDLLACHGRCEKNNALSFELLGRKRQCLLGGISEGFDEPEILLASIALNDILDGVPDIATSEYSFASLIGVRTSFGLQKWEFSQRRIAGKLAAILALEMRWSPRQYPRQALAFCEKLRDAIFNESPALSATVRDGTVTFEIVLHEPGTTSYWALV